MPFKKGDSAKYNGMRGGRIGGKVSSAKLTPEERKQRGRDAVNARWERARAAKSQEQKSS